MSEKAWKVAERRVAAALGTRRDVFAFERGDIEHQRFAVDVKRRKAYSLNGARANLASLAATGRVPIVVHVDQPGRGRSTDPLVILRLSDFAKFRYPEDAA